MATRRTTNQSGLPGDQVTACAVARPFFIVTQGGRMSNTGIEKTYAEAEVISLGLIPSIKNRITLYKYRKSKKIGFYRFGRCIFYGESHLREFLKSREHKAKGRNHD
jgi:hypothetical protein